MHMAVNTQMEGTSRCANMHGFAITDGIKMFCVPAQVQTGKL